MSRIRTIAVLCAAAVLPATQAITEAQVAYTGVNLATAAFNSAYNYPSEMEVDYFIDKGMNVFRLPFLWERLQPTLYGDFNAKEAADIANFIEYATGKGATVVLDPHNYAQFNGKYIGTPDVPNSAFADFWTRLATPYKDNDRVIFGLMNEPTVASTAQWVESANVAIAAIRETSADNMILVPGNGYSGAHSWGNTWYGGANATEMKKIVDPGNNFAFDIHQYLDKNSSGTSPRIENSNGVPDQNVGRDRLVYVTQWMRDNGYQGFLGEFAIANQMIGDGTTVIREKQKDGTFVETTVSQIGDEAMTLMLDYMDDNSDVWLGWAWWAAGQRWNEYMFTMQPTNLGQPNQADRLSMLLVEPWLVGVPEPGSAGLLMTFAALYTLKRRRA